MADPKTVRRRLERMRVSRRDAMHGQLARDVALQLLDENGSVSAADVEQRMAAVWTEPDEQTLGNMLAAKARAGVEHEDGELSRARECVTSAEATRDKYAALAEHAAAGVDEAHRILAEVEARLADAQELSDVAATIGDAAAAPQGRSVDASAGAGESRNGG